MKTMYLSVVLTASLFLYRGPAAERVPDATRDKNQPSISDLNPTSGSLADTSLPADTLTAQVAEWHHLKADKEKEGVSREVLKGATRDLSLLDIRAYTLDPGKSASIDGRPSPAAGPVPPAAGQSSPADAPLADADLLVIVKEGSLTLTLPTTTEASPLPSPKVLDAGGVALFAAGTAPRFTNASTAAVTYYLFRFQSRLPEDKGRSPLVGTPFLLDWKDMEVKKTDKGESRPIFSRPVAWLGKIDLHATTLNPGEVSHAPHIHRSEEIILLRSGHVQEYIDGQYHKASAGDLIFLPSGVPHAVENKSNQRCEYFALQWLP